jgi:hypothetical protein
LNQEIESLKREKDTAQKHYKQASDELRSRIEQIFTLKDKNKELEQ